MKVFGILTNPKKDHDLNVTLECIKSIINNNQRVCINSSFEKICKSFSNEHIKICEKDSDIVDCSDYLMSLGGDGTFLKMARKTFGKNIPLIGVNLGNLGFLSEIATDEISSSITKITNGECFVENRMVLEASVMRGDKIITTDYALNDCVVTPSNVLKMIHLNTYINDVFLEYIPGDGVIIATPTGSTAYSLSAGGPFVEPDTNMIIITPICAHTLYSRSCITSAERKVKITLAKNCKAPVLLTLDGQNRIEIKHEDIIIIKKASFSVNIVRLNPEKFFDVLRTKIHNRGVKNKDNEI